MNELTWRRIPEFPDYWISEDSDILSMRPRWKKSKLKASNDRGNGYLFTTLFNNYVARSPTIHRLVAETFIPNPYNKACVNHKDGNKLNNCLSNLEWVTYSENTLHAYKTGLQKPRGKANKNIGLTEINCNCCKKTLSIIFFREGHRQCRVCENKKSSIQRKVKSPIIQKIPVEQLKNGKVVAMFESGSESGRNGFNQSKVSACCLSNQKHHKGFQWRYKKTTIAREIRE